MPSVILASMHYTTDYPLWRRANGISGLKIVGVTLITRAYMPTCCWCCGISTAAVEPTYRRTSWVTGIKKCTYSTSPANGYLTWRAINLYLRIPRVTKKCSIPHNLHIAKPCKRRLSSWYYLRMSNRPPARNSECQQTAYKACQYNTGHILYINSPHDCFYNFSHYSTSPPFAT
jgi:hypothetical protein